MGNRDIQETYLNSMSKSTPETDFFPRGTISLLTSVIISSTSVNKIITKGQI
jgi:hypothetical protein